MAAPSHGPRASVGSGTRLLKNVLPEELIAAVRIVAAGDALIAPAITKRLIEHFARSGRPLSGPAGLEPLTPRELEVLRLVGRGLSNAEIAAELIISDATAKTHVKRILAKLGARDRVQLVVVAYETGLVAPGKA
jgi:DNA-binding NarL/FixJ family response regulator